MARKRGPATPAQKERLRALRQKFGLGEYAPKGRTRRVANRKRVPRKIRKAPSAPSIPTMMKRAFRV